MDEHNPDHYTIPRISGLRAHHFRREPDALRLRHVLLIAVVAVLVAAASIWLGGW